MVGNLWCCQPMIFVIATRCVSCRTVHFFPVEQVTGDTFYEKKLSGIPGCNTMICLAATSGTVRQEVFLVEQVAGDIFHAE